MQRRLLSAVLFLALVPSTVLAQTWADKPITMLITFPPGGPNDAVARAVGENLGKALGTSVVPTNRAGAGGTIAVTAAAHARPDGQTLLFATGANLTITPYFYKSFSFDAVKDLAPVIQIASSPMVLAVRSDLGVSSVRELVALLKRQPGKLSYGTPGKGTTGHLAAELFAQATGTEMLHVPYTGSSPMMMGLLGGQIDVVLDGVSALDPHVSTGKLRLLAVASPKRLNTHPDLPTLTEQGVRGADASFWNALLAPAGTPSEMVRRINREVNALLRSPDFSSRLTALGMTPVGGTPEELTTALGDDYRKWGKAIQAANIKPE